MKKYKTWEAIKMLTENPKLKFKLIEEESDALLEASGVLTADGTELRAGYLYYTNGTKYPRTAIGEVSIEDEWELVQQEVPFIEAIKAFSKGKTIYDIGNKKNIYNPNIVTDPCLSLVDRNDNPITSDEILNGHWYIKED